MTGGSQPDGSHVEWSLVTVRDQVVRTSTDRDAIVRLATIVRRAGGRVRVLRVTSQPYNRIGEFQ